MLYEISCNIGSRYNGNPLYIYMTYTLCIMAVVLQTRCLQMDNCEPDLSFSKYVELDCFRWLYIYMVIFVIFFPGMLNSRSIFFTRWTAWGLAPNEDNRTPGTVRLNVWNTVNWWILTGRDDVTKRRSSGASDFTKGRGGDSNSFER